MSHVSQPLLSVQNLSIAFQTEKYEGWFSKKVQSFEIISSVNLFAEAGEIVGIVGESGCGKSSLLRGILGSLQLSQGEVFVDGIPIHQYRCKERARLMQLIFQDANASLNPKFTAFQLISEPLEVLSPVRLTSKEILSRTHEYMELVGLPEKFVNYYPHQFSGGQAQRVAIARAIITSPKILLCDEPLAALDISIQAQIVNLFKDLNKKLGLTIILVSHDLGVVRYLSDRVYGLYLGQVVESGRTDEVYERTLHPYMAGLLDCVPKLDPRLKQFDKTVVLKGEIPSIRDLPSGCRFYPRCHWAQEHCQLQQVELSRADIPIANCVPHVVRCLRASEKGWEQKLQRLLQNAPPSQSQVSYK